jgi:hypothetical protein
MHASLPPDLPDPPDPPNPFNPLFFERVARNCLRLAEQPNISEEKRQFFRDAAATFAMEAKRKKGNTA